MTREGKILRWSSNLWNFADGMFGPLLAVFTERIGGNILDISAAWATYLIVTGIFVILVGRISDRVGKEFIMIAGYALTAVFTFGYLLVETQIHLLLVQAGLGFALALSNPTWFALYDRYSGDREDGYVWGLSDGQAKIATGIAIVIGGFIVNRFSFAALFLTMGTLQVLATLLQARIFFLKR